MVDLRRRYRCNLRLIVALTISIIPVYLWFSHGGQASDSVNRYLLHSRRKLRVSFINSPTWHDEVLVPVMNAWVDMPQVSAKTYLYGYRFGMRSVIDRLGLSAAKAEHFHLSDFDKLQDDKGLWPDILISTTCIPDYYTFNKTIDMLLEKHHTHFFCLFHDAGQIERKSTDIETHMSPWIRAKRVDFLTISPHVAEYAKNEAMPKTWAVVKDEHFDPPIHYFPPVFNFLPEPGQKMYGVGREAGFAVQGSYHRGRNQNALFPHLQDYIRAAKNRNETTDETNVHLVGYGRHPKVPEDLKDHVIFDEHLSYAEFYSTLMKSDAILPCFGTEDYYKVKASSTIAASLIAGTPLVADDRLMKAYGYLNENMVWMQREDESEMETLGRVLALSREERQAKKEAVRRHTADLVTRNRNLAREWTSKAVKGFPPGWDR